jgi:hypothetical protein
MDDSNTALKRPDPLDDRSVESSLPEPCHDRNYPSRSQSSSDGGALQFGDCPNQSQPGSWRYLAIARISATAPELHTGYGCRATRTRAAVFFMRFKFIRMTVEQARFQ